MALAFYPTWVNMIKLGQIRPIPRGMARSAQVECEECSDSDDESSMAYQVKRMTSAQLMRIICVCCGGIGHFARSGTNKCLTLINGVNVPKEDLQSIQYPNGLEPPQLSSASRVNDEGDHSRPKSGSKTRQETGKFRRNPEMRSSGKPTPRGTKVRKPFSRAKAAAEAEVEESAPNGSSNVQDAAQSDGASSDSSSGDNHQVKWAVAFRNIVVQ